MTMCSEQRGSVELEVSLTTNCFLSPAARQAAALEMVRAAVMVDVDPVVARILPTIRTAVHSERLLRRSEELERRLVWLEPRRQPVRWLRRLGRLQPQSTLSVIRPAVRVAKTA